MKKMMYLLFVFSLIPVVAVSADDFIDNRLQVNNSRLETEKEKTLGGQLDADNLEQAFREFTAKTLTKEQRPSIRKVLAVAKQKAAQQPKRAKEKIKQRELER